MKTTPTYLSEAHRRSSEKALAALAKQSPLTYEECIEQAKRLARRREASEKPDSNSSERYVPSRNANSAA